MPGIEGLAGALGLVATMLWKSQALAERRSEFKANPIELLPVALPKESAKLLGVQEEMLRMWERGAFSAEALKDVNVKVTPELGAECWSYLQVALLDYMYCGGRQMLGQVMAHPDTCGLLDRRRLLIVCTSIPFS